VSGRAIAAGDAKLMVLGMGSALDWVAARRAPPRLVA